MSATFTLCSFVHCSALKVCHHFCVKVCDFHVWKILFITKVSNIIVLNVSLFITKVSLKEI